MGEDPAGAPPTAASPTAASPTTLPMGRAVGALSLHAAAVAAPVTILLFGRAEIAERLRLLGEIVGEATTIGVVAVLAALLVPRTRDILPAGVVLFGGALLAAVGLGIMAWTIEVNLFLLGGVLAAIGVAPALVLPRVILTSRGSQAVRFRTMSWYWAAVGVGAAWPLGLEVVADPTVDTLLWISAGVMIAAALFLVPHLLLHDEDTEIEDTAHLLDVPWARRAIAAAAATGVVVIGGADSAQSLLTGEWQRTSTQTAAVLAAGGFAAALICAFGPWYHRLHRLVADRRADAIGIQLLTAGTLVVVGGLSFTYIGLIVAWAVAGGALGLAAAGLDAASFPVLAPDLRRIAAARQVLAVAIGGAVGALWNALVIGSWSDQWKIALCGIPLMAVGWRVRRFAASARDSETIAAGAASASVPRRVAGLDGEPVPALSVEHLDVAYGPVQVLFDVNLRIDHGQVVALLGTNGAGKTTLLRAISGLEPTLAGRVVYAGLDITKTRPTWRVGMGLHQVVGGAAMVGPLTVAENLRLFAHGVDSERRDGAIDDALDTFPRLRERLDQYASTLSGGEQQMLALAKVIMVRPSLLLLDEFSLGLAPSIIADLLPIVRRIADDGAAVLLVEQSVNIALSVSDYAYVMEKGEIGYEGDAADLRGRPDLLRAAYLEGLVQALDS